MMLLTLCVLNSDNLIKKIIIYSEHNYMITSFKPTAKKIIKAYESFPEQLYYKTISNTHKYINRFSRMEKRVIIITYFSLGCDFFTQTSGPS